MKLRSGDIVGVGEGGRWILVGLHEPIGESAPKLVGGKRSKAHKEEHAVQNWDRNDTKCTQEENGNSHKGVNKEVGQSSLLYMEDFSILISFGKSIHMSDGSDCGSCTISSMYAIFFFQC